jgi:hypothetical protein
MKVPLAEADLGKGRGRLIFYGTTFHVMGLFGEHADRLYHYVSQSSGAGT